jgi:ketosteroid isomerase-like protein
MDINTGINTITATILSLERHANERWNNGDVEGPLEIYADDVTFFDPITAARIDGWTAVAEYFRTVWAGKVRIHRYEMINPQVVTDGAVAVLSYNLVNYVHARDGSEKVGARWNSTQVYRRTTTSGGSSTYIGRSQSTRLSRICRRKPWRASGVVAASRSPSALGCTDDSNHLREGCAV